MNVVSEHVCFLSEEGEMGRKRALFTLSFRGTGQMSESLKPKIAL